MIKYACIILHYTIDVRMDVIRPYMCILITRASIIKIKKSSKRKMKLKIGTNLFLLKERDNRNLY